jgi:phthalate 4,5-dioxygenase reductase subunit
MTTTTDLGDDGMALVVADARTIALDIRQFELRDAAGADLPPFTPGAHIAVQTPGGMVRKYSLCNDAAQRDRYVIAVRRDAGGRGGSADFVDRVRAGSQVRCSRPRNDFPLAERAAGHLFIAGGIGITPIMAMIRHLVATDAGRFKLVYCTRSAAATAFLAELSAPALAGHVVIHHDDGDPGRVLDLWPVLERPAGRHVYCCGPRPMLEAVRDMTGHWNGASVHFESFVDTAATQAPDNRSFRVRLARSGEIVDVPADQTILEALRRAGHVVPSSCESGTCGTCRTRLLAGEALHRDLVLSESEHADNIMVCVSRARGDELLLDR